MYILYLGLITGIVAVEFPDLDTLWDVNGQLLEAVATDNIPQRFNAPGSINLTTDQLCTKLIQVHMTGFGEEQPKGSPTNDEFLRIKAPWKKLGFNVISWDSCIKALTNPYFHRKKDWLDNFAGYHVGKKFEMEKTSGTEDRDVWYVSNRNGFQSIQHQVGPICGDACGCGRGECHWGWQYADQTGESPFVQRWNPASANAKEGMSLGFPVHFVYLGKPKAECIVWLNFKETCLQCFNRAQRPPRSTIACPQSFAHYEIVDEV